MVQPLKKDYLRLPLFSPIIKLCDLCNGDITTLSLVPPSFKTHEMWTPQSRAHLTIIFTVNFALC